MKVIVFTGDSHTDGTGASAGMSWPDQLGRLLGRDDLEIVNVARAGAPIAEQVALWDELVAPHLFRATGGSIVFGMGGYNDITMWGAGPDPILTAYVRQVELARGAGARHVAGLDVIRLDREGAGLNRIVQAVNTTLRDDPGQMLDRIVDFTVREQFNRPDGPYEQPPFSGDRVHLDDEGQRIMAEMALPVFLELLA